MDFDAYAGLLCLNDQFNRDTMSGHRFTYDLHHPAWKILLSHYPLSDIAGNGDDFSRTVNLLHWLSENTWHRGDYDNHVPETALALLAYSFGRNSSRGINCRGLSIILTECCLAIGIPARTVSIIPASPFDTDNHVVTLVHVQPPGKWVMLDPTWNAYCLDVAGQVLNPWELRALLSARGSFRLNPKARYNGGPAPLHAMEKIYRKYLAKNLYYLHCPLKSTFDPERTSPPVFWAPDGLDVLRHRLLNLEYRIANIGPHPLLVKWHQDTMRHGTDILYASSASFFTSPLVEDLV